METRSKTLADTFPNINYKRRLFPVTARSTFRSFRKVAER